MAKKRAPVSKTSRARKATRRRTVSRQKIQPTRGRKQTKKSKVKKTPLPLTPEEQKFLDENIGSAKRYLSKTDPEKYKKLIRLERKNWRFKTFKKKPVPKPKLTPAQIAERQLAPGKARKRRVLRKAREEEKRPTKMDGGFEMFPVSSSNLAYVGYKPERQIMRIEFLGGNVYDYFSVPPDIHAELMAASSHGKYLHWTIKVGFIRNKKYPYKKVR